MEPMILFTDADDTLLTPDKQITKANAEAVSRALEAGHRIVITTGRALAATLPLIRRLGLEREGCYAISFNGAQIWDCGKKKTVFRKALSQEDTIWLFEEAEKAGIHCQAYDETSVISRRDNLNFQKYCEVQKIPGKLDPEIPYSLKEPTVKLLFIDYEKPERAAAFRNHIMEQAGDRLSLFFSNPYYVECVCAGISKGFAVHYLSELTGIPMSHTIAAGDSENDISMIREAGIGCAVANAEEAVKKAADYITERDCTDSAVAEIIERFMLK
ncbi:MAG: Cof-type HAD-IIB family hydrolase [Lachnospiraceae bacterium]|nr:Cof-type HAD-IIB family hydrolase [Lachnospiraceae bacterium]